MAGDNPRIAVYNFVEPLQRTLSCVTQDHLNYQGGYYVSDEPFILTIGNDLPVPLATRRRTDTRLSLSFNLWYRVVRVEGHRDPYRVRIAGYEYGLDDPDGREVLAYHWHPESKHSWADFPHLHIGAGADVGFKRLIGAHLRTQRIAFEEFLWVAIHELGVKPLRNDWRDVLKETLEIFTRYGPWPSVETPD